MSLKCSSHEWVMGDMGQLIFLQWGSVNWLEYRVILWFRGWSKIKVWTHPQSRYSTFSLPTATERKLHNWPQRWPQGRLRVGGNRLPISRYSQRKVAAVKANYTLDLQRTTVKPTDPLHLIISELCWQVQLLLFVCNHIKRYVLTCTVPANPTPGKSVESIIADSVILLPITKTEKQNKEEREALKTRGEKEGPQCVSRQCPHFILTESWLMIKRMLENSSFKPVSHFRILSV